MQKSVTTPGMRDRASRGGMQQAEFPRIGELFVGRYRIEDIIGTGGFSQVYRATQNDLGREVAIKVLKPVNDPTKTQAERERKFEQVAKRFEREARLISRLKDRNTVVMYDYGTTNTGLLYMVLEYVDGITISQLLQTSGPLAPDRVVKILRQALTSLHEAHVMGVLHRDIKPGNIMVYDHVGRADLVKVLDFGIAKTVDRADGSKHTTTTDVTADGVLVGTPRYMSPEQIRGKTLGPGSDIYSLGLVAYEMLMGMKAVDADSSLRIIARHLDTDPIRVPDQLEMPGRLREIINRMLVKDPSVRFATCEEVLTALENWDRDIAIQAADDPTVTTDSSISREAALERDRGSGRGRWIGIAVAVLVVAGLIGTVPLLIDRLGPAEATGAVGSTPAETAEKSNPEAPEKPAIATVVPAEETREEESDEALADTDAAADAARDSIEAAHAVATNQAPTGDPDADDPSEETTGAPSEKTTKKVVEARAERRTTRRKEPRRTTRPKKNRRKEEKPSKVDSESDDDIELFGIE